MTIEKLTEDERELLATAPIRGAKKALRCLDAALARAEAAGRALEHQQALVEREEHLTRQLCVAQSELSREKERFAEMILEFGGAKDCAESEAAALRAEVERLRRMVTVSDVSILGANELRTRLAAAEALLRRARNGFDWNQYDSPEQNQIGRDLDAFLSTTTQPAASAAPCTPEERAVLDALAAVATVTLLQATAPRENNPLGKLHGPCAAELARRAAKEKA